MKQINFMLADKIRKNMDMMNKDVEYFLVGEAPILYLKMVRHMHSIVDKEWLVEQAVNKIKDIGLEEFCDSFKGISITRADIKSEIRRLFDGVEKFGLFDDDDLD